MNIQINLSDKAIELLKQISIAGFAVYKDFHHSLEEFLLSKEHNELGITTEEFLERNFNGTRYLISELEMYNLVYESDFASDDTFYLTSLGRLVLKSLDKPSITDRIREWMDFHSETTDFIGETLEIDKEEFYKFLKTLD